jgi:hypothetical protein
MNNWLCKIALAAIGLALLLPGAARAQTGDNDGCGYATLSGDYAFTISGQIFSPKGTITREGVAMTHFDGKGGITQVDFVMQYPDMSTPPGSSQVPGTPDLNTNFNTGETGTYTVFEDCTGEMEIDFPPQTAGGAVIKLRFALSDEGRAIHTEVYYVKPPQATGSVPALIHSEGRKLGLNRIPIS